MLTQNLLNKRIFNFISNKSPASCAGFFIGAVLLVNLTSCDLVSYRVYSKPLIQVEAHTMTVQDFSKALAFKLRNLDPLSAKDPSIIEKFKRSIISDFIVDSFVEIWFKTANLSLRPDDVESEVQKVMSVYPDDKTFRSSLAEEGLSHQDWKKSVELAMKRQLLFAQLQTKIDPIKETEIKSYYENNRARYYQKETLQAKSILLKDEAQADVVLKLSKKAKFEDLVTDYSIETPRPKDGLFGWIERESSNDFEVLFVNKKNELIGPIRFEEGFRLFKVIQRRPARQKLFEEVQGQIKKEILALRETARFSAWLDEQIKRYKIYKNAAAIESIQVETRED